MFSFLKQQQKKNLVVSAHSSFYAAHILGTLYIISSIHSLQRKQRLNSFFTRQSSYCIINLII